MIPSQTKRVIYVWYANHAAVVGISSQPYLQKQYNTISAIHASTSPMPQDSDSR
jgi:hypothetical protein